MVFPVLIGDGKRAVAMCAYAEVLRDSREADVALLSLGTGERTRRRPWDE